jgi:hypothetical protein
MSASKIAVIETRLPYTDRRALSEAWFSALHLAHDFPAQSASAQRPGAIFGRDPQTRSVSFARVAEQNVQRRAVENAFDPSCRRRVRAEGETPLRRLSDARPGTARRAAFERARSYAPFRTSITIAGANGTRVHLIVRRVGPTLHVVALCPPAVEAIVRRALASADLHFRARGERVAVDVNAKGVSA